MPECRRVLCSRRVIWGAVLLVIINLWLFVRSSVDGSLAEVLAQTRQRERVLEEYRQGDLSPQTLASQCLQADAAVELLGLVAMKQADPQGYPPDLQTREQALREAYPELSRQLGSADYDKAALLRQREALYAMKDSVDYAASYPDKVRSIEETAAQLGKLPIFATDQTQKNIAKTARDYAALADIQPTAGNDASTLRLLAYPLLPLTGLAFSGLLVTGLLEERKYGLRQLIFACQKGRGALTRWRAATVLLGSGIYSLTQCVSTMAVSLWLFGSADFHRMAQSIPALFSLTVPMTLGQLWLTWLILSILGQLMITMAVWAIFCALRHRGIAAALVAAIAGFFLGLYKLIPAQSAAAVLKYANPIAALDIGSLLCSYRNIPIGSVPVEKGVLAMSAMAITCLLCLGLILWQGARQYSVRSHGTIYQWLRQLFTAASRLYHRLLSRLPVMGIEACKSLVIARGWVVILVFGLILPQLFPAKPPVYSGSAEFMRDFYERFEGSGISQELLEYTDSLERQLSQVRSDWDQAFQAYTQGLLSPEEYERSLRTYEAYEAQRQGLAKAQAAIEYIRQQEALGHHALLADPTPTQQLLADGSLSHRLADWLGSFTLAVLVTGLFAPDRKRGLAGIVRATPGGRTRLMLKKCLLALLFSGSLFILSAWIKTQPVLDGFGYTAPGIPVHSVPLFSGCPMRTDLLTVLVLYWLWTWMAWGCIAILSCILSRRFSQVPTIFTTIALTAGPEWLGRMGLPFPGGMGQWKQWAVSWLVTGEPASLIGLPLALLSLLALACILPDKS